MFGLYQRPVFYRRTPTIFDEMLSLERSIRAQNQLERLLFPEIILPRMFYIIQEQQKQSKEKDAKENKEELKKGEKETKPEEKKEEKEIPKETPQKEDEKQEKVETKEETIQKEQETKEEKPSEEIQKEVDTPKEEVEQKKEDSIAEQNEHEETDELLPKHEIDDENYSIQTKIITKNDGKFKHIFTEERGLSTGIKKSVETRTIGDKSMSLTRISYPDGKVDEHEDRQNINNDEEFEAFKNEWLSTFPVKAQQIKHETQ